MTHCIILTILAVPSLLDAEVQTTSQQIRVLSPTPAMLDELTQVDLILSREPADSLPNAKQIRQAAADLRPKLEQMMQRAAAFNDKLQGGGQIQVISDHNERVTKLKKEWQAIRVQTVVALRRFRLQLPALMMEKAVSMLDSGDFETEEIDGVPATKCNLFVQSFARLLYGYRGLDGQLANQMVASFRKNPEDWSKLYDSKEPTEMAKAMSEAAEAAKRGELVLVAWENQSELGKDGKYHGHIAVVLPEPLINSDVWGMDLPRIAQAGKQSFPKTGSKPNDYKLSQGFEKAHQSEMVIYSLKVLK